MGFELTFDRYELFNDGDAGMANDFFFSKGAVVVYRGQAMT
jgi:hypothetical protein